MRGNHPGEGKREQQPEKTQPAPALGPSGAVLSGSIPGITLGWGTAVAVQGCPFLSHSEHPPAPFTAPQCWDWETDQQQQQWDDLPVSGMLHQGAAWGMCQCWAPCPAQLCLAVPWGPFCPIRSCPIST